MSPLVDFTTEDIDRSKVLDPAYYKIRIDECEGKLSKAGDSTNYIFKGKIIGGPDGKEMNLGLPYWLINSKVKGPLVAVFAAVGITVTPGQRFDTDDLKGKELYAFIGNEVYNGNDQNKMGNKFKSVEAYEKAMQKAG